MVAISTENQSALSLEFARSFLRYDAETGKLYWIKDKARAKAGDEAGAVHAGHGYRIVRLSGRDYLAHRLAWFVVHGEWPKSMIDHRRDGQLNNRLENLREATHTQNRRNVRALQKNNTSGVRGVRRSAGGKKWEAKITVDKRVICLGTFDTLEAAAEARRAAELRYFGEFAPA